MSPICPICKKEMPLQWIKMWYHEDKIVSQENRYRCECAKCEGDERLDMGVEASKGWFWREDVNP